MLVVLSRTVSVIVLSAISLHIFWAINILIDHSALNANAINALYRYAWSPEWLVGVLLGASVLAVLGISCKSVWTIFLLFPQQIILLMSASGAIESAWLGQFADGVLRPHVFILADQFYSINLAIWHTVALISYSMKLYALRLIRNG